MNTLPFTFCDCRLVALGSGALHWPDNGLLVVSDLHLGKSERFARRGAPPLPPYETRDTLARLENDLDMTGAARVICLGDSFDDPAAAKALPEEEKLWITRLQAGRDWTWIEGNHDPGPVELGGSHRAELRLGPLTFRHIAATNPCGGEVSGHYHPKARLRSTTRPCFLKDSVRLILPSFGTYTGGLRSDNDALLNLMRPDAVAILTGRQPCAIPMPRQRRAGSPTGPAVPRRAGISD